MNTTTDKKKKYKPYPEYKDSGVEWLGDVPEHWEVDRLRWTVLGCKNGIWGNEPDGVDDLVCVRVADFDRTKFRVMIDEPTVRAVTPSERRGRLLQQGDLLLEKSGGGELQPVGAVMLFEHDTDAVCSNFVARMPVSDGFDFVFLTYLHAHLYARRVNTRSIKQTTGIQNLDSMAYLDERVACPPSTEQQAIADFLDRRTGEIDELISKKERVIELLKEKRTAIISHAVTKGLNLDAKMKDSGIDWLGEIPEHWEVKRLKYLAAIKYGLGQPPKEMADGLPLLRATNVERGKINPKGLVYVDPNDIPYERDPVLKTNDIIVVRSGAYTGDSAIVPPEFEGAITGYDMVVRARTANSMFIAYSILGTFVQSQIDLCRLRAAQPHLNAEELGGCLLVVPSKDIQHQIVTYLDARTTELDILIARVTEAIEKLKEYRTALISAAVTGKIDVREKGGKQ
jgi:type I restriction enzyme S subunit